MSEVGIKEYLIGFSVFLALISAGLLMIAQVRSHVDIFEDDTSKIDGFEESFDKADQLNQQMNQTYSAFSQEDSQAGTLGVIGGLFNIIWNTLKNLPAQVNFLLSIVFSTTQVFGIPTWVYTLVSTVVIIIFIFAIIKAVTNMGNI